MSNTKRIKRVASVFLIMISVLILWIITRQVISLIGFSGWDAVTFILTIVGYVIVLGSLVIALSLLCSIRKDESPFNCMNVKRLKTIAVLLVLFEPYFFIAQLIHNRKFPLVSSDGNTVLVRTTLNGLVVVVGLIVYCVALVFEYGISLQKQVDETL